MTPFEYLFQYHNFAVADPKMGLSFQTSISGYNSTYSTAGGAEMMQVTSGLAKKYFRSAARLPTVFNILNEPLISPTENYSMGSLNRAFQSRGSPHEFRAAVRLAFLAGRCTATNAAAYCRQWFTNDCVSFAGNYSGVSPSTPVFGYAVGITGAQLTAKGVAKDVALSKDIVQLPPRRAIEQIAQGDLLLTIAKADKRGIQWRHIAVVEGFTPLTKNTGLLSLAEWGGAVASQHTVRNGNVTLHDGSGAADRNVYTLLQGVRNRFKGSPDVIAYNGTAPHDNAPALRIFFDASSFDNLDSRGWLINGKPAPEP
jgi:hypothetical protein